MEGTLLALAGAPPDRPDLARLNATLSERLGQPVVNGCTLDPVAGIRELAGQGARRIVVLPLLLSLGQSAPGLPDLIRLCSQRWPFLAFHLARPPGWQEWARCLSTAAREGMGQERDVGLVLQARSESDCEADANLARLAWLVEREGGFARVLPGFEGDCREEELRRLGIACVRTLHWPHPLGQECSLDFPLDHPSLVECLLEHRGEALLDDSLQRPAWSEVAARLATSPRDEEEALRELDRRINAMLPPGYQGTYQAVSAQPMGSAPLLEDEQGGVAWDQMWTSFCELALAGGPSHRGTLLEAVPADEALADPEGYARVVAEIERGIRLVTGLSLIRSASPGWVGVECDSPEMALWMVRAIIVENVMVRREDDVIYLPAGPAFRLEHEIKNVVTVVAKTFHYWSAHRAAARRLEAAR